MLINATSLSKYWGGWWHREFMPAIWWPNDVCNLWLRQSHRQTFCFRSNLFDFPSFFISWFQIQWCLGGFRAHLMCKFAWKGIKLKPDIVQGFHQLCSMCFTGNEEIIKMKAIKKSGKLNQTICVNVPILKYGDQFERKKKNHLIWFSLCYPS